MFLNSNLRAEVVSAVFGQTITPSNARTWERELSVDEFHRHNLIGTHQTYGRGLFIEDSNFFDPHYDCDFTNLSDLTQCWRGGELYERPKGWYRLALKVKGKYPDGDAWLGPDGWRSHSVPGEWPVSFHGTSADAAKGIITSHYVAGTGAVHGRGIYSTPRLHIAEAYGYFKTFTSQTTGKDYKVIMQNRINPAMREICQQQTDYWLIRVNEGTSAEEERRIVESSIRPYGILIKELNAPAATNVTKVVLAGSDSLPSCKLM